ncbi:MAG TPA: T9SS type A sorting domain-containing protein [Bacteroidales bacterium]
MRKDYLLMSMLICVFMIIGFASDAQESKIYKANKTIRPTHSDVSQPIRDIQIFEKQKTIVDSKEIKNKLNFREAANNDASYIGTDPVVQNYTSGSRSGSPEVVQDFNGGTNAENVSVWGSRVAPPDTQGDVGPDNYVQMTNLITKIFDKDGNLLLGPIKNSTFWQGFIYDGIDFGTFNNGDPVVLYDEYEDRWIVSQFKSSAPYYQLIAISTSPDPTGTYYRYAISYTALPDYPKLGIWNDGFYITTNDFAGGSNFVGSTVVGFPKTGMYDGTGAEGLVFFFPESDNPFYASWLPADADGPTPPPTNGKYYCLSLSYAVANTLDLLTITPDWTTPANSTASISHFTVASFSNSGSITQPNGSTLGTLADRLMYRLQYRNFGTHQSMVVNHSVSAAGKFGVRWYELQEPSNNSNWSIYQEGTFKPADGQNRWMGSIAMNGNGDIALGYSVTSSTLAPSIRFTGQSAGAPNGLGIMDLPETSILEGTLSQTGGGNRWGDYSMMSVDPDGDTSFWFTQEYVEDGVNWGGWATRIAEFHLNATPPAGPAMIEVTPASLTFDVLSDGTDNALINIANTAPAGSQDLVWSVSLVEPPIPSAASTTRGIQIPAANPSSIMRNDSYEASAGPAPLDGKAIAEQEVVNPMLSATSSIIVYGVKNSAPAAYAMFDDTDPGTVTDISPWAGTNFSNAAEIDFTDEDYMYEVDMDGGFRKINLLNGLVIELGNVGISALDMGVDYTTGIYYVIDDDNLYTLDVDNASVTLVGSLGAGANNLMIGMTFNTDGDLYMYDIITDNMWSCNKATGACTVIGSIGFDANFGQSMAWDEVNGQAVLSAFNQTTFQCEYRVADLTTGNTAFLGKIGPPADLTQFAAICIPATVTQTCPWLSVAPEFGTTAAGSSDDITVSVDAAGLAPGTYECQLTVYSNASNFTEVVVPVTLNVTESSSAIVLPFLEDWESSNGNTTGDNSMYSGTGYSWAFETTIQDKGRANWGTNAHQVYAGAGALTLDKDFPTSAYAVNSAIITMDMSNYTTSTGLELSFWWTDHGDEEHANDKVWIRGSNADAWVVAYDINPMAYKNNQYNFSESLDIDALLASAGQTVSETFQMKFGQEDNGPIPNDGISFDDINVIEIVNNAATLPFIEDWESYSDINYFISPFVDEPTYSWSFETDLPGKGKVSYGTFAHQSNGGAGAMTMEKDFPTTAYAINATILTINLVNYVASTDLELSFYWTDHGDEEHPNDKVWIRGSDSDDWVLAFDINPQVFANNQYRSSGAIDIDQLLANAIPSQTVSETFQVKFGQEDNGPRPNDGLSFDDITIQETVVPPVQSQLLGGLDGNHQSKVYDLMNYPNPFKGTTTIQFTLESTNKTKLTVYNSLGVEVATLFDGTAEGKQVYQLEFNSIDLPSGIYFYHLQTSDGVNTVKKMQLIK